MKKKLFCLGCLAFSLSLTSLAQTSTWKSISTGTEHSVALRSDGTLWGCGSNLNGQLALRIVDQTPNQDLVQITDIGDWSSISCGAVHTIGIREDKTLWGWGGNLALQISESGATSVIDPIMISSDQDWKMIDAGQAHTLAVKENGTLWSWGFNFGGQLGHSNTTNVGIPMQIGEDNQWITASAGGYHSLGIKSDSTLWGWGFNGNGQVGLNPGPNVLTPTQIGPQDMKWIAVSAGFEFSAAVNAEGHLYTWGFNGNGQAGTGNTIQVNTPTFIHEGPFRAIRSGSAYSFAIHQDGSLYAWGANINGSCGIPNLPNVLTPTLVNQDNNWFEAVPAEGLLANNSVFGFHSLGLKEDRLSICVTGSNYIGQLGTGNTTGRGTFECIVGDLSTSTVEERNMASVELFPNPIKDVLHVEWPSELLHASWVLRDMKGIILAHGIATDSVMSIPMGDFNAGIYIISATTDEHYFSKKIVKQ